MRHLCDTCVELKVTGWQIDVDLVLFGRMLNCIVEDWDDRVVEYIERYHDDHKMCSAGCLWAVGIGIGVVGRGGAAD